MTIRHICVIKSQPKLTKDTMLSQILKKTATTVGQSQVCDESS
ncbi:hypothetical protein VCHA54P500_120056 [Vibrio chagasii]|nr:hypothetical protein VCHA34P117_250011 [Vibrio chagasii]CAH6906356.1 hypothetical protein VCHA48P439_120056 [Vibrio chagasii]CAH6913491.1 hypothetical protein VCHA40O236_120107 [Vibrio chagasii]CAH6962064.1 hypothetical protein VCHA54P500_120056 [Vibrio chagasii]CAH7151540.1 hypothetical protein VCHA53O462_120056 [Vibrio chagasii]